MQVKVYMFGLTWAGDSPDADTFDIEIDENLSFIDFTSELHAKAVEAAEEYYKDDLIAWHIDLWDVPCGDDKKILEFLHGKSKTARRHKIDNKGVLQ